jgi:hypothetical protein
MLIVINKEEIQIVHKIAIRRHETGNNKGSQKFKHQ